VVTTVGVNRLDDQDYPAVTMGQAAELLDVQPAFLRSLDAADVIRPARSAGGHRRYSRRQLERAARLRALFDQGLNLDAARRIVGLEDQVERLTDELTDTRERLNTHTHTHDAHSHNGHIEKGERPDT
jgi:MerR family transcriptional regulator, heat shock protein HspR